MPFENYFDKNSIFAENDRCILRRLQENDKESYMALQIEVSDMPEVYKNTEYYEYFWNSIINEDDVIRLSLHKKENSAHIGNALIRNVLSDTPEMGLDIKKDYRRQGYAQETVRLTMDKINKISGKEIFKIRIMSNNIPSLSLFRKLGAIEKATEDSELLSILKKGESYLSEEEIAQKREKEKDLYDFAGKDHIIVFELHI